MLFCSAALLLYTAVIVPVQICLWTYDDPCNTFPTLYFDAVVDTFFMVLPRRAGAWIRAMSWIRVIAHVPGVCGGVLASFLFLRPRVAWLPCAPSPRTWRASHEPLPRRMHAPPTA